MEVGRIEARDRLEELTLLVRLSKEVRAFKSFKSYQYAVEEVVSVSRQNEGVVSDYSIETLFTRHSARSSSASHPVAQSS